MASHSVRFALCGMALLCGCDAPVYTSGGLLCASSGAMCPSGYYCASDGRCWRTGESPRDGGSPLATDFAIPTIVDMSGWDFPIPTGDARPSDFSVTPFADLKPGLPAPSLTAVYPTVGPSAGNTPLTIFGASFVAGASVTIGGVVAMVQSQSATKLAVLLPPHAGAWPSATTIVVTNPDGQSAMSSTLFAYFASAPAFVSGGKTTLGQPMAGIPKAVVSGDYNNDGHADIAVAVQLGTGVTVLLGDGKGGFAAPLILPVSVGQWMAQGDFNGDSRMDFIVANNAVPGVYVLLSTGAATWGPAAAVQSGACFSVTVGDINNDNKLDVVCPDAVSLVTPLLGHGDGSLTALSGVTVGSMPLLAAIGDLNNDGMQDVVVSNMGSASFSVLLGSGNGSFRAPTTVVFPANAGVAIAPKGITLGDWNGDGKLDVATANMTGNVPLATFLGNGDGTFQSPTYIAYDAMPSIYVANADLNGDHFADLIVASQDSNDLNILYGDGLGHFGASAGSPRLTFAATAPRGIAITDLDGDGKPDIVYSEQSAGDIGVLRNSSL